MFSNLNFWEIAALALLGLFIFGPERLPKVISDGVRMLRNIRDMARNATADLSRELGTEVRLEDLHPKTFIRKHLLSEEEEQALRRPFDDAYRDVRSIAADANDLTGRPRPDLPAVRDADQRHYDPPRSSDGQGQPHQDRARSEDRARPSEEDPARSYEYGQVRPYDGQGRRYEPPPAGRYDADAT